MIDQFVKNEDYSVLKSMVHDLQMLNNHSNKDLSSLKQEFEKKMVDFRTSMMAKADITKLREITESLKNYAKYEDFKLLYGKVVPPVHKIEQEIIDINKNFE